MSPCAQCWFRAEYESGKEAQPCAQHEFKCALCFCDHIAGEMAFSTNPATAPCPHGEMPLFAVSWGAPMGPKNAGDKSPCVHELLGTPCVGLWKRDIPMEEYYLNRMAEVNRSEDNAFSHHRTIVAAYLRWRCGYYRCTTEWKHVSMCKEIESWCAWRDVDGHVCKLLFGHSGLCDARPREQREREAREVAKARAWEAHFNDPFIYIPPAPWLCEPCEGEEGGDGGDEDEVDGEVGEEEEAEEMGGGRRNKRRQCSVKKQFKEPPP